MDAHVRMPREPWSYAASCQGTTRGLEGLEQILPENLQRECGPADASILDCWPPGLRDSTFLLFKVCGTL